MGVLYCVLKHALSTAIIATYDVALMILKWYFPRNFEHEALFAQ